jgi:hypothetical protein
MAISAFPFLAKESRAGAYSLDPESSKYDYWGSYDETDAANQ